MNNPKHESTARNGRRHSRLLGAVALLAAPLIAHGLDVPLHKSSLVPTAKPVARVSVGAPEVADVLITGPRQVYVVGKNLGSTNVILWDEQNRNFAMFDVNVTHDLRAVKERLYKMFPDEKPEVASSGDQLVLSGTISSITRMDAFAKTAASFSPEGKVMNLMGVGGGNQVMLEVTVAELSQTLMRRFGINLLAVRPGETSKTRFGVVNGGALFPPTNVPIFPAGTVPPNNFTGPNVQEILPVPGAITSTGLFLSYLDPKFLISAVIDAAKENGLAQVLAEPTLVTMSGQEAQFLSGGEFPIPVPGGPQGQVTVEFKDFGIGLRFLPLVLDSGRINMKLNVSVSELTQANRVVVGVNQTSSAFFIPALTKRSAQSSVELANGESLFIAGLISDNMRDVVSRFPGLGDIPILGQLFRSQEFQKDKSELVIFVTPRLAQPTTKAQIRLPTEGLVEPNDLEYYLLGKTLGKYADGAPGGAGAPVSPAVATPAAAVTYGLDVNRREQR